MRDNPVHCLLSNCNFLDETIFCFLHRELHNNLHRSCISHYYEWFSDRGRVEGIKLAISVLRSIKSQGAVTRVFLRGKLKCSSGVVFSSFLSPFFCICRNKGENFQFLGADFLFKRGFFQWWKRITVLLVKLKMSVFSHLPLFYSFLKLLNFEVVQNCLQSALIMTGEILCFE